MTRAATRIQASFRGHQVRRDAVLQQKEADFCRQMEQLHTRQRPQTATEDGTGQQRRSQNTGDGGKLAMEGAPWLGGTFIKNENQSLFAHFMFEGFLPGLGWALLSLG